MKRPELLPTSVDDALTTKPDIARPPSHQNAYLLYQCCAQLLGAADMALAVQRYCERASARDCVALAQVLHGCVVQALGPQARAWLRVDARAASAVQVAQMYATARSHAPQALDRLFQPDSRNATPGSHRAVAGVAAEAVRIVLGT